MNSRSDSFHIAMLIREIYSKTTNIIADSLRENGLTHQQIIIIKLIGHSRQMTISDICKEMSLTKGTVSGIVSRLENLGYIEKFKVEDDKRNTFIRLSHKGFEFAHRCKDSMRDSFDKVFEEFSGAELKEIESTLNMILDKIDK
ncbi:MAG: MarR family winged helix-turn-helix transcriptional regulator [Clostridium sp.]